MQDRLEVCKNLIDKMVDEDSAIATIIYGEDGNEEEANELAAYVEDKYGIDVEVHNGGQPVYYYFLSVE